MNNIETINCFLEIFSEKFFLLVKISFNAQCNEPSFRIIVTGIDDST